MDKQPIENAINEVLSVLKKLEVAYMQAFENDEQFETIKKIRSKIKEMNQMLEELYVLADQPESKIADR